jgi:hypothetical protein
MIYNEHPIYIRSFHSGLLSLWRAIVRMLAPHSAMCPLTLGLKQDLESAFGGLS